MANFCIDDEVSILRGPLAGTRGVVQVIEGSIFNSDLKTLTIRLQNGNSIQMPADDCLRVKARFPEIKVTTDGRKTRAVLYTPSGVPWEIGEAICHPGDSFDFRRGAKLALSRLKALDVSIDIPEKEYYFSTNKFIDAEIKAGRDTKDLIAICKAWAFDCDGMEVNDGKMIAKGEIHPCKPEWCKERTIYQHDN